MVLCGFLLLSTNVRLIDNIEYFCALWDCWAFGKVILQNIYFKKFVPDFQVSVGSARCLTRLKKHRNAI